MAVSDFHVTIEIRFAHTDEKDKQKMKRWKMKRKTVLLYYCLGNTPSSGQDRQMPHELTGVGKRAALAATASNVVVFAHALRLIPTASAQWLGLTVLAAAALGALSSASFRGRAAAEWPFPRDAKLLTFRPSPLAAILTAEPHAPCAAADTVPLIPGDKHCVRVRGVLSRAECLAILAACELDGFESLGEGYHPTYRNYERCMYEDAPAAAEIARRLHAALPAEIVDNSVRAWRLVGCNEMFRASKYAPGGRFGAHRDANYTRSLRERSFITAVSGRPRS
jgi:hypothetical protein